MICLVPERMIIAQNHASFWGTEGGRVFDLMISIPTNLYADQALVGRPIC